jgi:hypothetical protein
MNMHKKAMSSQLLILIICAVTLLLLGGFIAYLALSGHDVMSSIFGFLRAG